MEYFQKLKYKFLSGPLGTVLSRAALLELVQRHEKELWPREGQQRRYDRAMISYLTAGQVGTEEQFDTCDAAKVVMMEGLGDAADMYTYLRRRLHAPLQVREVERLLIWLVIGTTYDTTSSKRYLEHDSLQTQLLAELGYGRVGTDQDALPEGYGLFGVTATNPVPVRGIREAEVYMKRLIYQGKAILHTMDNIFSVPTLPYPVIRYKVKDQEGNFLGQLHISPHNKRTSGQVPSGFTQGPAVEKYIFE